MSLKLLLAAGAFAALAAVPASAQGVRFDRAALADPAAAAALYAAVEREAVRVCRKEHDRLGALSPTVRRRAVEACVVETVETALETARVQELARAAEPADPRLMALRE